ncbi:hypothetical protein DL96DRAFT_1593221 [Flagelloscypha sp. PMI_526]|nr:hypothetical protein DL96DRAFT_1593221 [Flagelloscypha sp. PMI_526]
MSPRIVLTGASRGIGLSARLVTFQRTQTPELSALVSEFPDRISIVSCDISKEREFTQNLNNAIKLLGGLDSIILNAGVASPMKRISSDGTISDWKHIFDVNFFSLVTALQGEVILVSSGAAVKGMASWGAYNASKAALNSLGRTLAQEEPDITTVAVRPGVVETDMQTDIRSKGVEMKKEEHQGFIKLFEEGKLLKPEAPGYVLAALAISASPSLSGEFVSWDAEECKPYRAP